MLPIVHFPILLNTNTFSTSKEKTISLQRTVPTCPLFGGSTVMIVCVCTVLVFVHYCRNANKSREKIKSFENEISNLDQKMASFHSDIKKLEEEYKEAVENQQETEVLSNRLM